MKTEIQNSENLKEENRLKANDRVILAFTFIFSYLFYEQNAGINFLLFDLLFITTLLLRDPKLLSQKKWLLAVSMCLVSALGILFHSSALAVITNLCGLLLLSAFSFDTKTSAIFSFFFSCYSVFTSFIQVVIDASLRFENRNEDENKEQNGYKYFTIFIVLLLCILFFAIYKQANPLFAANTELVNFDFISFPWIIFTLVGFLIVEGLFHHRTILPIEAWEKNLPLFSKFAEALKEIKHKSELSAGILLFCFLNLMLVVLNAGDINTIWLKGALPKGISHSDFVHNGVTLIILSIVIATGLIMFLFRYNFNNLKNSSTLKLLIYLWVVQNIIMLFSTASRNQLYIHDYNLTYKRVGVYIWLFLAMIGLIVLSIKVWKDHSNWFLVRSNFAVWFGFLALSSTLNWDVLITRYNLNNKPIHEVDFYYLFSLSDSNIPELLEVTRSKNFSLVNGHLKNFTNKSAYIYTSSTYKSLMKSKIKYYFTEYKSDWQSWDLRDKHILNNLIAH